MKSRKVFIPLYALLVFLIFISSCNKDKNPEIVNPEPPVVTDSSYKQYGTPFENIPATEDIVMYEINLRAFSQGGNLNGVINRLDEIKALGVNVIWLMPIHPIGAINSVNSPYSVKNYKKIGSEYGTLNDLRKLTDEAHKREMAVVMDWVANHTAWDNPWITNKSWYTQDGSGNIVHPPGTNWLDVADLNFNNPEMRLEMIDAMKYWVLEANVDGFRCDYADGVPVDFWQQSIDTLLLLPNRDYVFLAEGNRADHLTVGFNLIYAWDFYFKMKDVFNGKPARSLFLTHESEYQNIPAGKQRLRYTTNHDESAWENTPVVFFKGLKGALSASVSAIFMGGVPLFYTGQEVGRKEKVPFFSNSPINWNENPETLQAYKQLMNFYIQSDAAKRGTLKDYSNDKIVCFSKTFDEEEIIVITSVRNTPIDYSLPISIQNSQWTNALDGQQITLGTSILLNEFQYLILTK